MIVTIDGSTLRVGFGYNPDYISAIKEAPDGRRWNKATREWLLPITINNLRFIRETFNVAELDARIAEMERPLQAMHHYEVDWRCTPFTHQVKALDIVLDNPAVALFHEMGLGKTLVAIKAIEHRLVAGEIKTALIVCPKTVLSAWVKEFAKYSTIKPIILAGSKAQRTKALHGSNVPRGNVPSSPPGGRVFLINYDLLRTMQGDLAALGIGMLVYDESQAVKTYTSQRAKAAYALKRGVEYVLLLTGTPITRDPSDVFSQYRILDERVFGSSFYAFRNYYFQNQGRYYPDWKIKPGKLDEIKAKMALRGQRLLKRDALDLPPKLFQVHTVEMEPEQRRIYREIERELMTEINEQTIAVTFLPTRLIRLNQICSGYLPTGEGNVATFPHGKLRALRELVDGYDGKIVVFATFRHDVAAIEAEFQREHVAVIDGDVSLEVRATEIERFQTDPACRVIVLQTAAGGLGITLTAASLCVFYSQDYNFGNKIQASDRLHRIGQTHAVMYIDLICQDSIEEIILEVLEEKRLMAEYLQGDIADMVLERFRRRV